MSYQDSDKNANFTTYDNCREQIAYLGPQGESILLGWIADGDSYFTDDQVGFQRYVDQCLAAQAAGNDGNLFCADLSHAG